MEHSRLIRKHLPRLLGFTKCNSNLLRKLRVAAILTDEEINFLETLSEGYERNFEFWYYIRRKESWDRNLTKIFKELGQTGVTSILFQIEKEILTDNEYGFIKDLDPLLVKVVKPAQSSRRRGCMSNIKLGLNPNTIGLALVINITDYEENEKTRTYAQQDATYISELFSQLGYKVTKCEGIVREMEIDFHLKSLIQQLVKKPSFQSCAVYIGCHGSKNNIRLSGGSEVNLSDILLKFNDCEQLNGKPKLFIVQSSGICIDYIREQLTDLKDTAILVAPQQDELLQSFSIHTFTEVFMSEARRSELKEMLHKVRSSVRTQLQLSVSDEGVPAYSTCSLCTLT